MQAIKIIGDNNTLGGKNIYNKIGCVLSYLLDALCNQLEEISIYSQ